MYIILAEMLQNKELLNKFVAGDREAFKILYEQTKEFLFRVIYRMVNNKEETEDLMHDIYVKLFEKHQSYRSEQASIKTWIYHMAVNHTVNYLKRKKNLSIKLENMLTNETEAAANNEIEQTEDKEIIKKALGKVAEIYRACIILKDIEDRSYQEIAQITGLTVGAVKTRLNRGRKQFLENYKKEVKVYA